MFGLLYVRFSGSIGLVAVCQRKAGQQLLGDGLRVLWYSAWRFFMWPSYWPLLLNPKPKAFPSCREIWKPLTTSRWTPLFFCLRQPTPRYDEVAAPRNLLESGEGEIQVITSKGNLPDLQTLPFEEVFRGKDLFENPTTVVLRKE